ncbi:MAG: putative amino terminal protease [Nocardia sp.]|uniref:CPBP family intramembrane glutamic endopeptidase n=1 Tax=Nocardia sp. TaxID=1821 RepID=UPI00260EC64B|nr:type II CAAX endopeptidase family protein [Nocardia sp.]MCU1643994.1 putative amino terminal protease [Nocardia sp.]
MDSSDTRALRASDTRASGSRFGRLIERHDEDDFPFYNGAPVALSVRQWTVAVIAVAAGYAALVAIPQPNNFVALIPRTLFVGIPLVTLALITRDHWRALLREVHSRDVRTMFGFALLNIVVSFALALIVGTLFGVASNEAMEDAGHGTALDTAAFYVGTGIQLVGEEVFTMVPFLALMSFFFGRAKLSRRTAIVLAWLISALWFGAAHLPTYDWNFAQAFIVIGGARLVLTLAYIRTKNLWVSSGAHIINDWALFTQAVLVNSALIA